MVQIQLSTYFEQGIKKKGYHYYSLQLILYLSFLRLAAEDVYITALTKVKKATSIYESDKMPARDSQLTFQQALRVYEASMYDLVESRQSIKETIRREIDKLVQLKVRAQWRKKGKYIIFFLNK